MAVSSCGCCLTYVGATHRGSFVLLIGLLLVLPVVDCSFLSVISKIAATLRELLMKKILPAVIFLTPLKWTPKAGIAYLTHLGMNNHSIPQSHNTTLVSAMKEIGSGSLEGVANSIVYLSNCIIICTVLLCCTMIGLAMWIRNEIRK